MPTPQFNTYYRYNDLTKILHELVTENPTLLKIESIGKSHEGREVWLLTATNQQTGSAGEKPALWVDGNIHASEVSPSMACLYLIHQLVTQYGQDPDITRCLDTRTFYICPRVNPDGAEWALADNPKIIRSSTRPYPYDEDQIEGLQKEDVDGDGRLRAALEDTDGAMNIHLEHHAAGQQHRQPAAVGDDPFVVVDERLKVQGMSAGGGVGAGIAKGSRHPPNGRPFDGPSRPNGDRAGPQSSQGDRSNQ